MLGKMPDGSPQRVFTGVHATRAARSGATEIISLRKPHWARVYITTPKEMLDWWPEGLERKYLRSLIEEEQAHWEGFDKWHSHAKWAYTFGVLALFAGLALAVFPGWGATWGWWLAFGIACLSFVFEVFWQIIVVESCLAWEERKEKGEDEPKDERPWFVRLIRPKVKKEPIEVPRRVDEKDRI
ncbi:hypothetical protein ABZ672_03845 [Streptomyces mirabilis]|uniref:hypothetical protein n=1 Tax=Streptomyces mirabilis TaxID=68239 RepID=UPI00340DCB14